MISSPTTPTTSSAIPNISATSSTTPNASIAQNVSNVPFMPFTDFTNLPLNKTTEYNEISLLEPPVNNPNYNQENLLIFQATNKLSSNSSNTASSSKTNHY
ncbi:4922_t:CDS:2 [Scutellospora calospora]|uniref:4922_t:CDS:1 n=1 Tax=Scutellospora calospora TaxID=85575 RepID=A0ACA9LXQ6_9GLOM|nr:4922_t:CDS:2 [Scutellospora calospora]